MKNCDKRKTEHPDHTIGVFCFVIKMGEKLLLSLCNDGLALVRTAVLANVVSEVHFAALRALCKRGGFQLPGAGASRISASFGYFSLRYCHFGYTS